jgi:hypothetical protein
MSDCICVRIPIHARVNSVVRIHIRDIQTHVVTKPNCYSHVCSRSSKQSVFRLRDGVLVVKSGTIGLVVVRDRVDLLSLESQASAGVGIGVSHGWAILEVEGVLENGLVYFFDI